MQLARPEIEEQLEARFSYAFLLEYCTARNQIKLVCESVESDRARLSMIAQSSGAFHPKMRAFRASEMIHCSFLSHACMFTRDTGYQAKRFTVSTIGAYSGNLNTIVLGVVDHVDSIRKRFLHTLTSHF